MSIRVGTWNVQYGVGAEKNRRRRATLDRHEADVWVLTATNDQLDLSDAYEPVLHPIVSCPKRRVDGSPSGPGCRSLRGIPLMMPS
jgi:hypothetical protein